MTNKFIEFEEGHTIKDKKTWFVNNIKHQSGLGIIYWYNPWRCYVFNPYNDTVWDINCLQDIIKFISEVQNDKTK